MIFLDSNIFFLFSQRTSIICVGSILVSVILAEEVMKTDGSLKFRTYFHLNQLVKLRDRGLFMFNYQRFYVCFTVFINCANVAEVSISFARRQLLMCLNFVVSYFMERRLIGSIDTFFISSEFGCNSYTPVSLNNLFHT